MCGQYLGQFLSLGPGQWLERMSTTRDRFIDAILAGTDLCGTLECESPAAAGWETTVVLFRSSTRAPLNPSAGGSFLAALPAGLGGPFPPPKPKASPATGLRAIAPSRNVSRDRSADQTPLPSRGPPPFPPRIRQNPQDTHADLDPAEPPCAPLSMRL